MLQKMVVIFGASGFVGKQVTRDFLAAGYRVRAVTRDKIKAAFLQTYSTADFINVIECDIFNPESVNSAINNADIVVNLIGILAEGGKNKFSKIHTDFAVNLAQACKKNKIENYIHLSALGVDKTSQFSKYAASKFAAEKEILNIFPKAIIIRPSIIFGQYDSFFNRFRRMIDFMPVIPLIGGGKTKFQPIFVNDVAQVILKAAEDNKYNGKIYEIAGGKIYSFKELMELMVKYSQKKALLVPMPFFMAYIIGAACGILPKKFLTIDQVKLLKFDNILVNNNLSDFDIIPQKLEEILPLYIS